MAADTDLASIIGTMKGDDAIEMEQTMNSEVALTLRVLSDRFAICRLPAGAALPEWALGGAIRSITWTDDETSLICIENVVPEDVPANRGWRALKVVGPLDFSLTGVLSGLAQPLAEAQISIFALSTYDTDYVLVQESALASAVRVLSNAGCYVEGERA